MRRTRVLVLAAAILLLAGVQVWAHHAFASEFDVNKPVHITGTVTKLGAGTVALEAANTWTGATSVSAGILQIGNGGGGGSLANTTVTIARGATLQYYRSDTGLTISHGVKIGRAHV